LHAQKCPAICFPPHTHERKGEVVAGGHLHTVESSNPTPRTLMSLRCYEDLVNFEILLRKRGYHELTIEGWLKCLKSLHIEDLSQYEIVYEILAKKAVSTNRKIAILNAYLRFLDFREIPPKYVPRYTRIESLPFVPTENKIDSLIFSLGGRKISTMLLIAKETGARLGRSGA